MNSEPTEAHYAAQSRLDDGDAQPGDQALADQLETFLQAAQLDRDDAERAALRAPTVTDQEIEAFADKAIASAMEDLAHDRVGLHEQLSDLVDGYEELSEECSDAIVERFEAAIRRRQTAAQALAATAVADPDEPDYLKHYRGFWAEFIEPDGILNRDQLARELSDYSAVMENASKVFEELANLSKPLTDARYIIEGAERKYAGNHAADICDAAEFHDAEGRSDVGDALREVAEEMCPGAWKEHAEAREQAAAYRAANPCPMTPESGDVDRYIVVTQDIHGDLENHWNVYRQPISCVYADRADANRLGEIGLGHDDFCIATLRDGKLYAYGPDMNDFPPEDRDSLEEIAGQLALAVHPDANEARA